MLLSTARTREDSVVQCVALIQEGVMRDRLAFSTLPELRAAVMELCAAREAAERSSSLPFLERLCNSLVAFLEQQNPPPAALPEQRQAALAQALELLPTCLDCALNAELFTRGGRAARRGASAPSHSTDGAGPAAAPPATRELRRETARRILDAAWPAAMVLPLLSALVDLDLDADEQTRACARLAPAGPAGPAPSAPGAAAPPDAHFVGLVQAALAGAAKFRSTAWVRALRALLAAAPARLLRDALCLVELSLQVLLPFPAARTALRRAKVTRVRRAVWLGPAGAAAGGVRAACGRGRGGRGACGAAGERRCAVAACGAGRHQQGCRSPRVPRGVSD